MYLETQGVMNGIILGQNEYLFSSMTYLHTYQAKYIMNVEWMGLHIKSDVENHLIHSIMD